MIWTHLAVALVAAALAFTSGWKTNGWRHDSLDKERIVAAQETERLRAKTADKAAGDHESFKEKERVTYQTITETVERIVDRPVYRAVCLDDDGLRALNAAITGREPATGEPAPVVP